jgi:hypothetical protein
MERCEERQVDPPEGAKSVMHVTTHNFIILLM